MVGPVFTLRYMPAREDRSQLTEFRNPEHPQRLAIETCPEGSVLMMDSRKQANAASSGDILIIRLTMRGGAGVVTVGGFRDAAVFPGNVIVGNADCVIVIPAEIADEAREMTPATLRRAMSGTLKSLSMVSAILMTSPDLGFLPSYLQVPAMLSGAILAVSDNPIAIVLLLGLSMLMDMGVLIPILAPILLPIAKTAGMDPVQFSIVMRVNLGIGLVTPPVGISLIVLRAPLKRDAH